MNESFKQEAKKLLETSSSSESSLLHALNEPQREAVIAEEPYILVLAGAGSGKTRVLAHRAAYLIQKKMIEPYGLMALTFTNKAAKNLKERIESISHREHALFNGGFQWVGTFHGVAHKLLRFHAKEVGLEPSFQIMDSEDALRLLKQIIKSRGEEKENSEIRKFQGQISRFKDQGKRASHVVAESPYEEEVLTLYRLYEETCHRYALVDFDELMLRSFELFEKESIRTLYQKKLSHVMVDEFQDTNSLQYRWLKRLCEEALPLTAVGDDDQSIYGWRGAKIENIQNLQKDFKSCRLIRLEQNYRSSGAILDCANEVIQNNQSRLGKTLWTEHQGGELPSLFSAFNEYEEVHYIRDTIESLVVEGYSLLEMAILYRSNAQSRVLENALSRAKIPYRVYGGTRFFERAEIKDALSYMRLIVNHKDDPSFERAASVPPRGIGPSSLETLRLIAKQEGCSLYEAATYAIKNDLMKGRARLGLESLLSLLQRFWGRLSDDDFRFDDWANALIEDNGLRAHFSQDKDKFQGRLENLEELVKAVSEYNSDETPLSTFLTNATLESGETQAEERSSYVSLMTLHSSKGLEFPVVFLMGLEDGLFPHQRAIFSNDLEEERRLCYVGITRAMKRLYLSYAESRSHFGKAPAIQQPSRFLSEISEEKLNRIREKREAFEMLDFPETASRKPNSEIARKHQEASLPREGNEDYYTIGTQIIHPKLGDGVVLGVQGHGAHARLQIKFHSGIGIKWIIAGFVSLKVKT